MEATITITGHEQALAAISAMVARARNPQGMFDAIGAHFESSAFERFNRGVGPDGAAWLPSQRVREFGGQTLIESGDLRRSLVHVASATGAVIGSNKVYAAIHQFGGKITAKTAKGLAFGVKTRGGNAARKVVVKSVTLPARPFLGLDADDPEQVLRIVSAWLLAGGGDAA